MQLQNLYKVTKTLTDVLSQNIIKNIDSSLDGLLNVTPMPPEKVQNPSNTLSLYMYHVSEDPYYKNAPSAVGETADISTTPMALCLYYILTAHHESDDVFDAETQQKLMGYALKTFHDFPVITDETRINGSGTSILDTELSGQGNSLQIIMRPVSAEEAISFWNSEDARTARLSAYYEVRVVMLKPEPPKRMPGIVLSIGAFVHDMGLPYLDCTRSTLHFDLPVGSGGGMQAIESTPARVSNEIGAAPSNNELELLGTNLTGQRQSIILKNALWGTRPVTLGGPVEAIEVNFALNAPDWSVGFRSDRVTLAVASQLKFTNATGAADQVAVVPGLYSAQVSVVHGEKEILSQLKQFSSRSNEVAFYVVPRIAEVKAGVGVDQDMLIIDVAPTFDLNQGESAGDDRSVLDIQVLVAGQIYDRVATGATPDPGQFSPEANSVKLRPTFSLTDPGITPVRLIVNGAESQPAWFEV